jgi:hypothetical protein
MVVFRSAMSEIGTIELVSWALCFALQIFLVVLLLVRRHYLQYPAFTVYLAASILQNVVQFATYRHWGFLSETSLAIAWSAQTVVTLIRCLAVAELCRHVFGLYRGIWGLIWRVLAAVVLIVGWLAMLSVRADLGARILYADRAVSLAVSFVIVLISLFARYYQVLPGEPARAIAMGLFLFSCFTALNDTVLETRIRVYGSMWNFLGTWAFIGSVLVWVWAFRIAPAKSAEPTMLPATVYETFSPEVNRRLSALNDRLSFLTKRQEQQP